MSPDVTTPSKPNPKNPDAFGTLAMAQLALAEAEPSALQVPLLHAALPSAFASKSTFALIKASIAPTQESKFPP
jgi:hypothetical protein